MGPCFHFVCGPTYPFVLFRLLLQEFLFLVIFFLVVYLYTNEPFRRDYYKRLSEKLHNTYMLYRFLAICYLKILLQLLKYMFVIFITVTL